MEKLIKSWNLSMAGTNALKGITFVFVMSSFVLYVGWLLL